MKDLGERNRLGSGNHHISWLHVRVKDLYGNLAYRFIVI
jgi:hypothetical protein